MNPDGPHINTLAPNNDGRNITRNFAARFT